MKENMTKTDIINHIGFIKNQKKISSFKIGKQLGHAENYFYRIESGEIQFTLEQFLETLEILGVTTNEFFCTEQYSDEEKNLINNYRELSKNNQNTILDLVNKLK